MPHDIDELRPPLSYGLSDDALYCLNGNADKYLVTMNHTL